MQTLFLARRSYVVHRLQFIFRIVDYRPTETMPFFLSSMFYISVVDLVLFFYAEYNSALKNILCIFTFNCTV